jgi:hypothetical protein
MLKALKAAALVAHNYIANWRHRRAEDKVGSSRKFSFISGRVREREREDEWNR